jgi:hypothetical protein
MKKVSGIVILIMAVSFILWPQAIDDQQAGEIKPVFKEMSDAESIGAGTLKGLKATEVMVNIRELFNPIFSQEESKSISSELVDLVKTGLIKWGLGIIKEHKGPDDKDWVIFEVNINLMQNKEVMPGGVTYSEIYFYYIEVSLRQLVRIIRNLAYKSQYPIPTWTQYAMGTASSIEELHTSLRKVVVDLSSDFITVFKLANRR